MLTEQVGQCHVAAVLGHELVLPVDLTSRRQAATLLRDTLGVAAQLDLLDEQVPVGRADTSSDSLGWRIGFFAASSAADGSSATVSPLSARSC